MGRHIIEEVTSFRTSDGVLHENRQSAEAHQKGIEFIEALRAWATENGYSPELDRDALYEALYSGRKALAAIFTFQGTHTVEED